MISKINEQENEVTTAEYMENKFIAESVLSELEINVMKQKRRQETKKKKIQIERRKKEKRVEIQADIGKERLQMGEKNQLGQVKF